MDPDVALANIRELFDANDPADLLVGALREQFGALDGWLSRGGFLPTAWRHGQSAASEGGE